MRLSDGSASNALILSVGVTMRAMTRSCLSVSLSSSGVVELVSQDTKRFFKDGFGNREVDVTAVCIALAGRDGAINWMG